MRTSKALLIAFNLLAACALNAQTNLQAWHTNGQTWVVWTDTQPPTTTNTYDLYVRSALSTNLAQWTPIGRALPQDWKATRLRTFTPASQWRIPTAGGPYYRLATNEALFVYTPHVVSTQYFAVVRHGFSVLTSNNVVGPIVQPLTQVVTCHPQFTSTTPTTSQSYTDYAFWLDGRDDWTNSRPDVPVLGNASFNSVASLFRVYQPTVSQAPGAKLPLVLFGHPMNRNWAEWVPGTQPTANLSFVLTNALLVTLDDGVWFFNANRNEVDQGFTFWFGYWEGFDRFAASETNYPPNGALVVDFTVRRNLWLLDWLIGNQSADSNRVAWIGSSMGSGGGAMNVRAHPERFSAATFFVSMVHDPGLVAYTGAQFGMPAQNLPTSLGLGIEDMFFPTNSPAPDKLPPMRYVWGVNDDNVDWNSAALGQKTNVIPTLAASRLGFITYWDERGHEPPSWAGHWAGLNTNVSDGSTILTAQYLTRYRNDQSFPAFSNDAHPDTNVFQSVPFCGTCTNWGTRNGYFDWDVATITDSLTNWSVTLWMQSTNTTSFSNDVPAFATARTDVTIRRAQQFRPIAGASLAWTYASNNVVIASGTTSADSYDLVTITNLTLYKDPARTRLEITSASTQPIGARLTLTTNGTGGWQIAWQGNAGYSSQLEHSRDLVAWSRLDLPAAEVNAVMSLQIPPYLLADSYRFFRLARQPLITSPIPTTPGFYTNLSFVHGGIARNYFLKVPAGWTAATNWPFVLLLPGHGQSATEFSSNQQEILGLADTNGWILAFGEATAGISSYAWFAYDNPNTGQPYVDDAAHLFALVDSLKNSGLRVNTNRVFAAGFSNGGSMTHYLAGKTNHPFAAFAIMESGTPMVTFYPEPYNRLTPGTGTNLTANVPVPWQPRPVLLMNMATSVPWPFEGRLLGANLFNRGARHNVARWTQANGYGSVPQPAPEPPLPSTAPLSTNSSGNAVGNARARIAYEDMRPDHNWPTNLVANGWSLANASRFPYTGVLDGQSFDQRLPEWVRVTYPHTLSPDPNSPAAFVRVDSGTTTTEVWRTSLGNRTNEVIFVGLSDGGHQWPNSSDKLPFDANIEVLRFFDAH